MAKNTITIELCDEDRHRLDRILEALEKRPLKTAVETAETDEKPAPKEVIEAFTEDEKTPADVAEVTEKPAEAEAAPEYSKEQVQAKMAEVIAAGKKAEARDIVTAYASKVSAIPAAKYGEVMAKLTALMEG